MPVESPELEIHVSTYEILAKLLEENGWKKKAWFNPDVEKNFQERKLTKAQILKLVEILNASQSVFEEKTKLSALARGEITEQIGVTYTFSSLDELCDALKERWVKYPRDYLQQTGSTFVIKFNAPRHLGKDRYEQLIKDLAAIVGTTTEDDAKRGEVIRATFWSGLPSWAEWKKVEQTWVLSNDQIAEEKRKFQEKMKDFSPEDIESNIVWIERAIEAIPFAINKATLRGVYGGVLLESLRTRWLHLFIDRNDSIMIEPKWNDQAVKLQERLNTLVRTKTLSLDTVKYWLLSTSPTFQQYAILKKTQDGKIDPNASMADYKEFSKRVPSSASDLRDRAVTVSMESLSRMNFPDLLKNYKDQELAWVFTGNNPALIASIVPPISLVPPNPSGAWAPPSKQQDSSTPDSAVQRGADTVGEKVWEFGGKFAENVGGFMGGWMQAIGKWFEKGGAIGGLAVAIISIVWAWKLLNKEYDLGPLGKHSGWLGAVIGFGGKSFADMAKGMWLIGGNKPDAKKPWDAPAGAAADKPAPAKADPATPETTTALPEGLSPSEKIGAERVLNMESLKPVLAKKREGYTATPKDYIEFLTKNMKDIPVSALLSRDNPPLSIFDPAPVIDPRIKLTNMDPNLFKRIARVYLTGKDFSNVDLENREKDIQNKEYGVDQIEKKYGIVANDTLSSALAKTIKTVAPVAKPAEILTEAQVIDKIKWYTIDAKKVDGSNIPPWAFTREIKKLTDWRYQTVLTVLDSRKIDPRLTEVKPMIVHFDKQWNLIDQEITIDFSATVEIDMWLVKIPTNISTSSKCQLKQAWSILSCIIEVK